MPVAKSKKSGVAVHRNPLKLDGKSWNKALVMKHVCQQIATSSKSLMTILRAGCDGNDLPDLTTLLDWFNADPEISRQYARAKEQQSDFMGEEFAEIHNKAKVPVLDDKGQPVRDAAGEILYTINKESAALARLEADNKKWLMAHLQPKKWGDKVTQEITGANGGPVAFRRADELTDDELAAIAVGNGKGGAP